jgi:capsule polysaccharide export protein KpsE/RkpR
MPKTTTEESSRADAAAHFTQLGRSQPSSLAAAVEYAWVHRLRLAKYFAGGFILTFAITLLIPSEYRSTAKIIPPEQSSGISQLVVGALTGRADALGGLAGDVLGAKTSGTIVTAMLQSRTVRDDIINQFDLRKLYWRKKYEDARRELASRTEITEDKKSGVITVAVEDRDPVRARNIAQAYVDEANKMIASLSTSAAHRERVFLEKRLSEVKVDLDQSALQLSRFSSEKRTLDPATQGRAMIEAIASLNGQLIAAESELDALKQTYTQENVRVRSSQARVDALRSELAKIAGTTKDPDSIYPSLTDLPLLGNSYLDLYRKTKIYEAVYETLTKQYELAKVEEAKELPTIKVMDLPVVPERKSWPPRTVLAGLGGFLFVLFGVAFMRLPELWRSLDDNNEWKIVALQISNGLRKPSNSPLSNTRMGLR